MPETSELVEKTTEMTLKDQQSENKDTKDSNQAKKSTRSRKKGKKPPKEISPEHIAEKRAQREAARAAKREAMRAHGLDPNVPPDLQFIKRPLLCLHEEEPVKGFKFKIMTYNALAQALIRRKLFPSSGNAVKWFKRSKVLLNEFKHYDADVHCLQEIDHIQYQAFWKEEFQKLGYASQFHRIGTKNHGVAIVWRCSLFTMVDTMLVDYDNEPSGDIPPRTTTKNAGLILALKFTDKVLNQFPGTKKSGILIGTTHLFWHPFGTFERTRQCYVVLNKMKELIHRVNVLQNNQDRDYSHWYPFICGDFNSQPFDTPYLSMTSKPVTYRGRAKTVIECSTSFTFSKLRDGEEGEDEEGGNIEKFGKGQPEHPVPKEFHATEEQTALVKQMENLHNSLDMRAISLYAVGYKHVHPENAGLDNDSEEPEISNWAETWRGLLDYIFLVKNWDGTDRSSVDKIDVFERENGVKIRGLLRMPPGEEMTKHGQPHEGEYPSDHLSMVCEIELNV